MGMHLLHRIEHESVWSGVASQRVGMDGVSRDHGDAAAVSVNRSGPIVLAIGRGQPGGGREESGGEPCRKDGTGSGEAGAVLDGKPGGGKQRFS